MPEAIWHGIILLIGRFVLLGDVAMAELSADAEREIRKFLEERTRQEEERQSRFTNRIMQILGLVLGALISGLVAAFYFFIDSVEAKATREARDEARRVVEANIGTVENIIAARADIVSAERNAEELATRADQILKKISDTRDAINKEAAKVEALEPLFGIAAKIDELKAAIATDPGFQDAIKGGIDPAPSGLVAAFASTAGVDDTEQQCPNGWSIFANAAGRVIVGAGSAAPPLSTRSPFATGGAEVVTLTEAQMPVHSHNAVGFPAVDEARGYGVQRLPAFQDRLIVTGRSRATTGNGGSQPHNNMPPYIALYFCKKD